MSEKWRKAAETAQKLVSGKLGMCRGYEHPLAEGLVEVVKEREKGVLPDLAPVMEMVRNYDPKVGMDPADVNALLTEYLPRMFTLIAWRDARIAELDKQNASMFANAIKDSVAYKATIAERDAEIKRILDETR